MQAIQGSNVHPNSFVKIKLKSVSQVINFEHNEQYLPNIDYNVLANHHFRIEIVDTNPVSNNIKITPLYDIGNCEIDYEVTVSGIQTDLSDDDDETLIDEVIGGIG